MQDPGSRDPRDDGAVRDARRQHQDGGADEPGRRKLRDYSLDTLAIHGGQAPDPATGSRAVPIYQTTSYVFSDTEHARQLFALEEAGHIYSRLGNPTVDVFEKRIALLEGGVAAVATSSGQAALTAAILCVAGAGDEIVASMHLYGGTYTLFAHTLPQMGVSVKFVDPTNPENFRAAISERTKAVVGEIIGNPKLSVLDVEAVAKVAHDAGIPLIVDSTFATPVLCRPIEWGADIVVHSATKWIGGHGNSIGGVVVDGGRFDWGNGKFPQFTEPDVSYNGVRFYNDFGTLAFSMRLRTRFLRDLGFSMTPFNAFLLLQGVETLTLRMERHSANALHIARHLETHPAVEWVRYPGLESSPDYELANKYFSGGYGGMVVFGIKGGMRAGARLINRSVLWSHLANVGDAKSLIIHPASTTHSQLSDDELRASGADPDLVRLSVGLEGVADLISELDDSLYYATGLGQPGEPIMNSETVVRRIAGASTVMDQNGEGRPVRRQQVIAVIGLSDDPGRPSYRVARKLQRQGYRIIPVNPTRTGEILGEPVYAALADIPEPVDVVQVFRAAAHAPGVAREAVQLPGRPVFWLQEGIVSDEAGEIAAGAGLPVVMNRCLWKEVQRLQGSITTYTGGA